MVSRNFIKYDDNTFLENVTLILTIPINNLDNVILSADDTGKISQISSWNLFGRLVSWFNGNSSAEKVNRVLQETVRKITCLCEIDPVNKNNYIKIEYPSNYSLPDSIYHIAFVMEELKMHPKFKISVIDHDAKLIKDLVKKKQICLWKPDI